MTAGETARAFVERLKERLDPTSGHPLPLAAATGVALVAAVLDIAAAIRETGQE